MTEQVRKTSSAGGVIINSQGDVLVVNQRGTSWSLPKGHIELGEESIEAAKREVYEESGIKNLEFIKDLGSYQRYKIDPVNGEDRSECKTITMYLFKTAEDIINPIDPENPEARWVPREQVAELLTHPKDKEFFLCIVNKI